MKVTRHIHKAIALAAVLIGFPVSQALAQGVAGPYPNNGQASEGKTSASIEWMKPSFDGGDGITFMTSATLISGQYQVTPSIAVAARLPITHMGFSEEGFGDSNTSLGNVYLGGRYARPMSNSQVDFGFYLPTSGGGDDLLNSNFVGFMADYDRLEAYMMDTFGIQGLYSYAHSIQDGVRLEGSIGPSFLIYTSDVDDKTDLLAHYGVRGWYDTRVVSIGAGFSGTGILTAEDASFGERTVHQGTLYLAGNAGSIRPHGFFRLPLDEDLSESVNYVFGLGLSVVVH